MTISENLSTVFIVGALFGTAGSMGLYLLAKMLFPPAKVEKNTDVVEVYDNTPPLLLPVVDRCHKKLEKLLEEIQTFKPTLHEEDKRLKELLKLESKVDDLISMIYRKEALLQECGGASEEFERIMSTKNEALLHTSLASLNSISTQAFSTYKHVQEGATLAQETFNDIKKREIVCQLSDYRNKKAS